jgi:queuine tRNA-ribosyltransferase
MVTEEPLGPRLLALHNLTFLMQLMAQARTQLGSGTFTTWSDEWLRRYRARTAFTGSGSANGR